MQIWVAVNEVDVGRIAAGTPVTFTCDTFPDQSFQGSVQKVRLNATMTQNVVMFTVEVRAENPRNILLPYLTAKVRFEVQRDSDVLMAPNGALRWYPAEAAEVAPEFRSQWKPLETAQVTSPGAGKSKKKESTTMPRDRSGTLWIRDGHFVRPLEVKLGASDGTNTA